MGASTKFSKNTIQSTFCMFCHNTHEKVFSIYYVQDIDDKELFDFEKFRTVGWDDAAYPMFYPYWDALVHLMLK